MVRTYRLGGAERERARALIRILSIDMDRVRWLDGHPMTVRVFDDGKCWVEYTGLVVCDVARQYMPSSLPGSHALATCRSGATSYNAMRICP